MRTGVAEVHQHTVTQILGHEAAKAGDLVGNGRLIVEHDLARVLQVEPRSKGGGADQVAEHDGDLASLGLGLRHCAGPQRSNSGEQLATVAD